MRLSRYLASMTIFLLAVAAIAAALIGRLQSAFFANPLLNVVLIGVWVIGIIYIFIQTLRLSPEIRWVQAVQRNRMAAKDIEPPPLMGSLARMMESRATPLSLTPTALRAVLDGIAVRLDESREIARYFTGLLIFLGLLGTFWGLLKTVGSVGAVVSGLSVTADPTELFTNLKAGLEGPLSGMGTAFGSSLLGLAGSLVLGFLDLQMGQAQNRFFLDLENWLFASAGPNARDLGEEVSPLPAIQALVDRTASNMEGFRQIMTETEDGRHQNAQAMWELSQKIDALVAAEENQQQVIDALLRERAENDAAMLATLTRIEQALGKEDAGLSANLEAVGHLRAIESGIQRLVNDQTLIRARALEEARAEITRLARTLGIATDGRNGG
jgi:phage shock protein PspC (stress-responsive transcriptional regulator)